jgi:hypothetical protein
MYESGWYGGVRLRREVLDPWTVSGVLEVSHHLASGNVDDAPEETEVSSDSLTVLETFMCDQAGRAHIIYSVEVVWVDQVSVIRKFPEATVSVDVRTRTSQLGLLVEFECRERPTPAPTLTPTPSDGLLGVPVLYYFGDRYPLEQFHLDEPHGCDLEQYHADFEVHSLEGGSALDPDRGGCGFSTVAEITIATERITDAVWADYRNRFAGVDH